ncbi:MAG: formate/nitrite transporter family protein [Bacteroides sp.]|nr:formate/nitrite transporter family protein [Bacillota bacterium]MCM1393664.1 formate/nitrite transporter family protein [[Eubacterium] siraeum]MCM1455196.1 formate/nitrite transporter family protein [Bacteroides sp.]
MLRKILNQLCNGVAAGLLITIGCCVYLGCNDFKWLGAILFAVALITICYKGYSLYTGRIGFVLSNANKDYFSDLLLGLLGNVIATAVVGIAVQYAIPNLHDIAQVMCEAKLAQEWWQTLIRGVMCGVLMYIAVSVYKEKKNIVGILFAIPVFILSGFEHSIADMGYFAIGGVYSAKAFGFIWLVILGNSIGALILPAFALVGKGLRKDEKVCVEDSSDKERDDKVVENNIEAQNQVSNDILSEAGVTCEPCDEVEDDKR